MCKVAGNLNLCSDENSRLAFSIANDMLSKRLAVVRAVESSCELVPNNKVGFKSDKDIV